MKYALRLFLVLTLCSRFGFAVGTVTQTIAELRPTLGYVVTFTWTGDSANGTVPSTDISSASTTTITGMFLYMVETDPGSPAPTANYDIVLNNARGVDVMSGNLANRHTSNTEIAYPSSATPAIDGTLSFVLTNNSVNSATSTCKMYFSRNPIGIGGAVVGNVASGATDSGNPVKVGGKYNSSAITLTDGQRGDVQLDASGYTKVNIAAGLSTDVASGATDSGNPVKVGGKYNLTLPTFTDGQRADLQVDAKGNTRIVNMDAAGNARGANVNASNQLSVTVDNTVTVASHAVTNAGTFAVQATEADGANTTLGAKTDAKSTATDATSISAMQVLKQISASVQAPPSQAVTNAGTFATQAAGDVAHDGVDSGSPVKVGYKAIAHGTNPTAVAAADRTDAYANRAGVPFVIGGHPDIVALEYATTAAATDVAIVTVAAGLKIVVTQIQVVVDSATSVAVGFRVGFGATTTPTTTGVVASHPGILSLSGSGVSRGSGAGIVGVGADGEDLRITCGVPTSGSLRVVVSYYTIES